MPVAVPTQETPGRNRSSCHLFEKVGALNSEDVREHDWVWPSHPLTEMPAPTSLERLTALTDSMDGVALLILSGQHLGFLPQFYGAKHEALGQLHPP